jgi:hypothetical protein
MSPDNGRDVALELFPQACDDLEPVEAVRQVIIGTLVAADGHKALELAAQGVSAPTLVVVPLGRKRQAFAHGLVSSRCLRQVPSPPDQFQGRARGRLALGRAEPLEQHPSILL